MEDIIHLLPDSVANQIAAGEVVQRPASVIKELVENSLDAGAHNIDVLVTDGGRTSMQVIDDGKGMSETDARMAFERHATSKILKADDLFALTTMGFRGEALASIAAVAQVELKTRRPDDELGTYLVISGSKVERQEPVACSVGSNFSVNNLFFNVPARRKFLKQDSTELRNVVSDFQNIVLTHPETAFTLYNNGTELYRLPEASLRQRVLDVFGKKLNADLLSFEVDTSLVSITGFVGKPETAKQRGYNQFFFVNGRYMRHPKFHNAVAQAFSNLIPAGHHVSYFIYLAVDPAAIDVNVSPTKTTITFVNEQDIWQVLFAAVKEALGKYSSVPEIEFDTEGKPEIPALEYNPAVRPSAPPMPAATDFNPFKATTYQPRKTDSEGWETLYASAIRHETDTQTSIWQNEEPVNEMPDPAAPHFLYKGKYIVMPVKSGLMVVDQHRAHICVLYDQYMQSLFQQKAVSQGTLFPEIIQFSRDEAITVEDIHDDLEYIGFELTNLGGGSYSITGVPSGLDGVNPITLLHDLVYAAVETGGGVREKVHNAIALTMAKATAIIYGQVLTDEEVQLLIEQLFALTSSRYTPDGHPVYTIISDAQIEKDFRL